MIHKLIWFIFTIILATVGISMYLQPNDLKSCNISPSVSGDCKVCHGYGKSIYDAYYTGNGKFVSECWYCGGRKVCPTCHGRKRIRIR